MSRPPRVAQGANSQQYGFFPLAPPNTTVPQANNTKNTSLNTVTASPKNTTANSRNTSPNPVSSSNSSGPTAIPPVQNVSNNSPQPILTLDSPTFCPTTVPKENSFESPQPTNQKNNGFPFGEPHSATPFDSAFQKYPPEQTSSNHSSPSSSPPDTPPLSARTTNGVASSSNLQKYSHEQLPATHTSASVPPLNTSPKNKLSSTSRTSNTGGVSHSLPRNTSCNLSHRSRHPTHVHRDQDTEQLALEIASLKQQINTLQRTQRLQDQNSEYPIRPLYTVPEEQWIERMLDGQRQVEEMYNNVGSLLEVLPLLDSDSHIIVDDTREDTQLALEEFCARYAPLVQDAHTQASIKEHINTLRSNPSGPVRGHKIGAINAISQLLRIKEHRTCIIICGHESAGKTTLLECLIGCRLGYSDVGRATVCPVIYTFVYKEVDEAYYQFGSSPVALEQCPPQRLDLLPSFVKNHMEQIKRVPPGISRNELLVKIVSGDIRYAGIIVDCPGTTISPQGATNAKEELQFKEDVKEIIAEQVKQANPHNSVILCLERKTLDQTQGGCGHFFNDILSKTEGYAQFQSRVKMVFNYNDHQCRGNLQNPWTEHFDQVDDERDYLRTYTIIRDNFFKVPPPPNSVFFISMKHVQDLYENVVDHQDLETLREQLLDHNSETITQLIAATDQNLALTFDAKKSFSFANLKNSIFDDMERSSDKYVRKVLDAVEQFRDSVQKRKDLLTAIANDESRYDNEGVVREAWEGFLKQWSALAQEEQQSVTGLPIIDLHFDDDEWCREYHEQFPLQLAFKWPHRFLKEIHNQPLLRYLEIHNIEILYEPHNEIQDLLIEHVDLFLSRKLNLVGAYERMIDSMSCRLATVHLNYIAPDEFHNLLNNAVHMRGTANIPAEAAYRLALKVLEIFYVQFLAYFKTIMVHFFQRAIDVALYLMRIDNPSDVVYVAKYKTPLATFRKVLFDAVEHWAEHQMERFFESIPFFKNSDSERIENKYREFAEVVADLNIENNEKLPQDVGDKMRNKLMEIFGKKTLAQQSPNETFEVRDFDESGAKVQQVALKTYALHNANMIRRFREEFRYEQIHRIFGDHQKNHTPDHMKSMLEGYCKYCLVHLPFISFRHPPGPRLQSNDSLVFVNPLHKKDLDSYLGALYGITDDTARGSQRQIGGGVLAKLVETFV